MGEAGVRVRLVTVVVLGALAAYVSLKDLVGSVSQALLRVWQVWRVKRQLDSDMSRLVRASKHRTAKSRECHERTRDQTTISE